MLEAKFIKSPKLKIRNTVHEERKHFPPPKKKLGAT